MLGECWVVKNKFDIHRTLDNPLHVNSNDRKASCSGGCTNFGFSHVILTFIDNQGALMVN